MKKRFLFSILLLFTCFFISGCGNNNLGGFGEPPKEANKSLSLLKYYVPSDYKYRPDLRGLAYSENEKKVYMKGDYDNDPDNVIAVVVYFSNIGKGAKAYTDEINSRFTDQDVKYTIKGNKKIVEIYARENYVIGNNVNYAYILDKAGYIYVVNIKGPKDKKDEIGKVVNDIYLSLEFKN